MYLNRILESAISENKAQYYFLLGRTWSVTQPVSEECINVLSKAVKLNPTHLDAWNSLGECLVHLKRFSEAKYCFLASLKHVNIVFGHNFQVSLLIDKNCFRVKVK